MLECRSNQEKRLVNLDSIERLCESMFRAVGEDPEREGLLKTPERFRKAILDLTSGYHTTPEQEVGEGIFAAESNGPIFVNRIDFFSLCEHHVLPFWGQVSIGYLPDKKILGLSKLARIVDVFSKRLQVQERLTREIAESIQNIVNARAVSVRIEANHMCMMMRGVRKQNSLTRTEFQKGLDQLSQMEQERIWKGLES
jgi:GTP cyclohydrolase I